MLEEKSLVFFFIFQQLINQSKDCFRFYLKVTSAKAGMKQLELGEYGRNRKGVWGFFFAASETSMILDLIYFSLSQTIVVFSIIIIIHKRCSYIFMLSIFLSIFFS